MNFEERLAKLRETIDKTSFNFRFESLFDKEEWINMNIPQRKQLEREFHKFIEQNDHLRIPYTTEDHIRMRLYNLVYDYNEIKNNFKAYI
ncbi:DUF1413 domain-containing protein [Staphylococcus sp. NAM3COL9]|uniref:DUF1413 domain-containing protein n=1 Tax=Staphylococcus sp. NAM3COL9 TaxID=1667172 RepID=UPI00070F7EBC|nr:DUF1413 domain-containing protein [Staphylococcus sp. NAM3COL9]KRG08295.1 hypothetical protein ACA31_11055 [Staphylococcus sp. NAM3COL9]